MNRPAGITIIAVFFIALAVLSLLWSGLVFCVGRLCSLLGGLLDAGAVSAFGQSTAWSGFLGIVSAAARSRSPSVCWP